MAKSSGKMGNAGGYILLGLLLLGLGGFGATNFGGSIRKVGTVGDTDISTNDYFRGLQNEISAVEAETGSPVTLQQARAMGLTDRVLSRVVISAALEDEATNLEISVGDEQLAQAIRDTQSFQGPDGSFNRAQYQLILQRSGLSERQYEENVRDETASLLLQRGVVAGTALPSTYDEIIRTFAGQRRSFTWAEVTAAALDTGMAEPSDDELKAFYEANIADYTHPETKQITYAWLTPDMILDTVEVDEASMRAAYEERESEFNLPERRLVERLVFANTDVAEAALARVEAGDATFETLVEERGLALADTDLGDVTESELGAAGGDVFAAEVGDIVVGQSNLGPALFRVNAVLAAQSTSFEEAQGALRDALALDRARRVVEQEATLHDDELAAGATLEELAQNTDMQLGTIAWTGSNAEAIAGFESFRKAASEVTVDDYPAIANLEDGGIFAMRLDEVQEAAPYPFEDVRDRVRADWEADARVTQLLTRAEGLADQLTEGASFEDLDLSGTQATALSRTSFGANLPEDMLEAAFKLEPGQAAALRGQNGAYVLRLDEVLAADPEDERVNQLVSLFSQQAEQDVAEDLFRALALDIQSRAGVEIDQAAINAVHASFQ